MYVAAQGVDSDNGDNSDVGSGIPMLALSQQSIDDHVSDQLPYIYSDMLTDIYVYLYSQLTAVAVG